MKSNQAEWYNRLVIEKYKALAGNSNWLNAENISQKINKSQGPTTHSSCGKLLIEKQTSRRNDVIIWSIFCSEEWCNNLVYFLFITKQVISSLCNNPMWLTMWHKLFLHYWPFTNNLRSQRNAFQISGPSQTGWWAMQSFALFFVVSMNNLLNKVNLPVILDTMALVYSSIWYFIWYWKRPLKFLLIHKIPNKYLETSNYWIKWYTIRQNKRSLTFLLIHMISNKSLILVHSS